MQDLNRLFIKYISKITRSMTSILEKDIVFNFTNDYVLSFDLLKVRLIFSPIMIAPD